MRRVTGWLINDCLSHSLMFHVYPILMLIHRYCVLYFCHKFFSLTLHFRHMPYNSMAEFIYEELYEKESHDNKYEI